MEKVIKFSGWTPSPNTVTIGMERDNKVFSLKFDGLPEYPNGTVYLHIDCGENGADSIEVVDGAAEIKRNVTQYEGEKEAYVEILADGDVVWHSDVIMVTVKRLPILGKKIEQEYPTAFEQALAQTAADKAAAAKSAADAAATAAGIVTEEAARQDAESKRVAAETARGKAEETRAEHERLREDAENERVKAENAREAAEANREQAEAAREKEVADALSSVAGVENTVQANEQQRVLAERTRAAQEQARQSAEQSRVEAEQARAQVEQRRETAETVRAEAERQRESMETSRQTAETARNAAENGRAKAEKARETAESQRQQAETARADAEGKRVQAEQGRVTAEQGRVKAEAQREEAMAQHAEKIAELEEEVAKKAQIDDTTVSGSEAWSSQHIVDMLCPPLEESGNPVVCYPVANSNLDIVASWEPTQEGEGTPSPDNIRPIHGRDSVSITQTGKNIIPYPYKKIEKVGDTYSEAGITYTLLSGGAIRINGVSGSIYGMTIARYAFPNHEKLVASGRIFYDTGNNLIFIYPFKAGESVNEIVYPQIEVGTTASPYEAPMGHRITTLTLPNTIYGGKVGAEGDGKETWGYIESYAGEALPAEWICDRAVYADGATPPTGAQVAYKLATPVPFTATGGGTIKALSGTNTILTDADTLTITGRADPIHIIQQLQAASAASAQALADVERAVTDI